MKKLTRQFALAALVATALVPVAAPKGYPAAGISNPSQIHVTYHGGPLLQNPTVFTLFWGQGWDGNPLRDHLNGFFLALFADGRYMANLSQYSANGYQIGNGQFRTTITDPTPLGALVTDAEVQKEIHALINAGALPSPQTDYLYVVCTPPGVTVTGARGGSSGKDFLAYHGAAGNPSDWAPYLVVPAPDAQIMREAWGIQHPADEMTMVASHELAEAVTDPLPLAGYSGWIDDKSHGEIGDIPQYLVNAHLIGTHDLFDLFTGADGTQYLVQKEWSQQDHWPVAFAQTTLR
jgi:hypothetical protein